MHIYNVLRDMGVEISNHNSDLHVKCTDEVAEVVNAAFHRGDIRTVSSFRNEITGEMWIEIPFAFLPWWERAEKY